MKVVMAKAAVDLLRPAKSAGGAPAAAGARQAGLPSTAMQVAQNTIALFAKRTQATGGLILLDHEGHPGYAFNTPRMAYGYVATDGSFTTAV
jgi:isoaspartyl peptidase/L-asparaginase-like protein (Ntn-hydrolase superfamily)